MPAVPARTVDAASPSISPRSTLPSSPLTTPKPFLLSATTTVPSTPHDDGSHRLATARLVAGHAEDANPRFRPTMEDATTISELSRQKGAFLAVYDGHGGSAAANLAALTLHEDFADALAECSDTAHAFRSAYASCDAALRASRAFCVGATAVTAYVNPGATAVTVANAGDARCVLGSIDGVAERLSIDHKADDTVEADRVRAAGGFVCSGRVNGVLAVSRALGDHAMKSAVVSDPHIVSLALGHKHRFLILACDGLWDVVEDDAAVAFVNNVLDDGVSTSPAQVARMLVRLALDSGSTDNVSVVVAIFDRAY